MRPGNTGHCCFQRFWVILLTDNGICIFYVINLLGCNWYINQSLKLIICKSQVNYGWGINSFLWMGFLCFCGMAVIMKAKINKSSVVRVMCKRGLNSFSPLFPSLTHKEGSGRTWHDINLLKTKRRLFYLKTLFVPSSKHYSSRL